MNTEKEAALPRRTSPRLQRFDYNSAGAYFITICTQDRRCLLSRIAEAGAPDVIANGETREHVGTGVLNCPQIRLTAYGEIAERYIGQLSDFYEHLSVEHYVIMPNHIHLLLVVRERKTDNGQSGTPVPTRNARANSVISQFVSTFKRFCNKEYGRDIWQGRFNDHVIRDREDYGAHVKYICENPMRWRLDELYAEK